jgi:hypothetical protein
MVLTCMHNQFRNNNNRAHALYAFLLRGRSFAVVRFWHSEDNVNWISCISGVRTRVLKLKPKMPEIEGILDVCLRPFAYLGSCTNIDWTSTWNVSKLQRGMRLTSNSSFNFCKLWFHFSYRAFALIPQGPTEQKPWRPCWCSRQKSLIKIIFNLGRLLWPRQVPRKRFSLSMSWNWNIFMGTDTFEHADFKSENFPHRKPQFSHKLLFYLR